MQFFWKYIDDLMGKGLEVSVILELLFYVSASLIPLALPLAILLSSIMTLGNLAENNELTALKASGLSLYRILRPLGITIIIISIGAFYFSNFVIPVANLKWRSLIYDIQQTKIATIMTPGAYSTELDGYGIKSESGEGNHFNTLTLYDKTNPSGIKRVKAESGDIYKSENGDFLFFKLHDGYAFEDVAPAPPKSRKEKNSSEYLPTRESRFKSATYKFDLSSFQLHRSNENLFKNAHEMLNIFQLNKAIDSIKRESDNLRMSFVNGLKNDHNFFLSRSYIADRQSEEEDKDFMRQRDSIQKNTSLVGDSIPNAEFNQIGVDRYQNLPRDTVYIVDSLNESQLIIAHRAARVKLRKFKSNLEGQNNFMKSKEVDLRKFDTEWHRKFALSFAVIVLFFIGAPLGAIVRKGGFGTPVVIAVFLFMVYYIISITGDNMVKSGVVSPALGMWLSTIILTPAAVFLTIKAANDSRIFDFKLPSLKFWKKRQEK